MFITDIKSGAKLTVIVSKAVASDYKSITPNQFWFDWKLEKAYEVYKLYLEVESGTIGLISIESIDKEQRLEIRLLAVNKENVGAAKTFEGITGCMLAFVGKLAFERYGAEAAISLLPKTVLREHYIKSYGFMQAGTRLFLTGKGLITLIKAHEL